MTGLSAEVVVDLPGPAPTASAQGALLDFLAYHLVPGVETVVGATYARTVALTGGPAVVSLTLDGRAPLRGAVRLGDPADLDEAVRRLGHLVGPAAPDAEVAWRDDDVLGPVVTALPGLRLPGQVDGGETAVRTVVGQQVSVVGARTVTGRIVAAHGEPVASGVPGLTHLFPAYDALAGLAAEDLPMPRARGRALVALAGALASGELVLSPDAGADQRRAARATLLALPGIGPWTADYVALRALGDPDVFLPTDIGVRNALRGLGHDAAAVIAEVVTDARWAPWRSHALMYLWSTLMPPTRPSSPDRA